MNKRELINKLMIMERQDWDVLVAQGEAIRLDPNDPNYKSRIDDYLDHREQDLNLDLPHENSAHPGHL